MSVNDTLPTISINLPFTNDSDLDTELKYTINRQDNILSGNPSLYDVFVSRWYVDSNSIESFRITENNQSDYWVGIMNYYDSNISTVPTIKNLPTRDIIPLYGEVDFLDIINKSLAEIYQYYQVSTLGSPYALKDNVAFNHTFTFAAPTYNFSIPNDTDFYPSGYDYRLIFTVNSSPDTVAGFSLILKNLTSNTRVVIMKNNLLAQQNVELRFSDNAFVQFDDKLNATQYCTPVTPFNVLKNTSGNLFGNWQLEIVSNYSYLWEVTLSNVRLNITARKLVASAVPDSFYCPYLELDETTQKLQFRYNDLWAIGKFEIYFSPKINSMLGFNTKYFPNINGTKGGYRLILPNIAISNTPSQSNMLLYRQNISTVDAFTDIESVNIDTTLNLAREVNSLSLRATERVLTSFIVDKYSPTNYSFTSTSNNMRKFRILQTGELTSFDVSFYVQRKNQKGYTQDNAPREIIQISSGMYADLLLLFIPANVN